MWKKVSAGWALGFLAACGYVNKYEEAVYDMEPVYCYQSLGKATCYDKPSALDERRLVNYFGPHPSRYDVEKPEPLDVSDLEAPPEVENWVKDPEPEVLTGEALRKRHLQKIIADKKYNQQLEAVYGRPSLHQRPVNRVAWAGPPPGKPEKITYQTLLDGISQPSFEKADVVTGPVPPAVPENEDLQ